MVLTYSLGILIDGIQKNILRSILSYKFVLVLVSSIKTGGSSFDKSYDKHDQVWTNTCTN
jgi:hypothetical protein